MSFRKNLELQNCHPEPVEGSFLKQNSIGSQISPLPAVGRDDRNKGFIIQGKKQPLPQSLSSLGEGGRKFRVSIGASLIGTFVFLLSFVHEAQAVSLQPLLDAANKAGFPVYGSFRQVLEILIKALLSLSSLVSVIFIVIAGYRFITSQGNEQRVMKAKKNLYWSVLGLALIVVAWIIVVMVINTLTTGSVGS